MDLLLQDKPELYRDYAIRDAEISARHVHEVWRFANDELCLDLSSTPVTLGSLAARNLIESWNAQGIDIGAVLDGRVVKTKRFDPNRRRYVYSRERNHTPAIRDIRAPRRQLFSRRAERMLLLWADD